MCNEINEELLNYVYTKNIKHKNVASAYASLEANY